MVNVFCFWGETVRERTSVPWRTSVPTLEWEHQIPFRQSIKNGGWGTKEVVCDGNFALPESASFNAFLFALGLSLAYDFWLGLVGRRQEDKKAGRETAAETISSSIGHSSHQNPPLPALIITCPSDPRMVIPSCYCKSQYASPSSLVSLNFAYKYKSCFPNLSSVSLLRLKQEHHSRKWSAIFKESLYSYLNHQPIIFNTHT